MSDGHLKRVPIPRGGGAMRMGWRRVGSGIGGRVGGRVGGERIKFLADWSGCVEDFSLFLLIL